MERKISKGNYIIALLLTIIIFSLGLTLGFLFDSARLNHLDMLKKDAEVNYLSLQFQQSYLASLEDGNATCTVLPAAMKKSVKDLSESLQDFIKFRENTKINDKEYELIGRRYLLDNLRYWLLAKRTKEKCDLDVVSILYFYSTKYCPSCPNQGVVLTYFKKILGEKLLIFPIDVDYINTEPMVGILLDQHSIREYPTLIVEEEKYSGIIGNQELKEVICSSFKQENELCK